MDIEDRVQKLMTLSQSAKKKRAYAKRVPMVGRDVLKAKDRPGYTRRYVNVIGDRIEKAIAAGWTIVPATEDATEKKSKDPGKMSTAEMKVVGTDHLSGEPLYGILMEIPTNQYEENRAPMYEEIDRIESEQIQSASSSPNGKFAIERPRT